MNKILVTGASGFIGSHLVARLDGVIALDIKDSLNLADICDLAELTRVLTPFFATIETVVHLAAKPGVLDSVTDPVGCVATNVLGSVNLLSLCTKMPNLKQILVASSSCASAPTTCPYGASKKCVELFAETFANVWKIKITALRFFTVYGSPLGGERSDMAVTRFVKSAVAGEPVVIFGTGEATREFTHVDDIVEGIVLLLNQQSDALYEQFDLSSGVSTSINELVQLIGLHCKLQVRYAAPRLGDVIAGNRAKHCPPGWTPRVSLSEGIAGMVAHYTHT